MLERCHVLQGQGPHDLRRAARRKHRYEGCGPLEEVRRIEAMSPEVKFAYFQSELSKCIRCNACRNVCPACSCRKCVFDSTKFDSAQKANVDSFEEKMFHIIRAFHVAGRCTDCGECSRVCPQGIPAAPVQPQVHQGYRRILRRIPGRRRCGVEGPADELHVQRRRAGVTGGRR